ncbi:MAG: patatin-like phospholipase family protein [Clostridia bacterium]|nr:patatin-like phospholipase family protein [Clostridia bacterium]
MKIGIALAGGGIRGIAHAGVLKALEDNNIKIDAIGGTSSGSLIASLYAIGYSPNHIYTLFKKYSKEIVEINSKPIVSGISKFMLGKKIDIKGLKTGETLENAYNMISLKKGIKTIADVKMPLVIPTVDIISCKKYVFTNNIPEENKENKYITDVSIGKAVRASSCFPAVFSPCEVENYAFVDGGLLDNIPVYEVKKQGVDKVIAVNFNSDEIDEESNVMDIVMKTIDIMGSKVSEESLEMSDYVLTVYSDKTGLLDTGKLDICYKFGYDAVVKEIDKIKEILYN